MSTAGNSVPFKTQLGARQVNREQVRAAMEKFDLQFRSSENDSGTLYAVEEKGKRYPPKRILELATGVPRNQFYGGKPSNDVFIALGFHIAESNEGPKTQQQIAQEDARLKAEAPGVNQLADDLFAKTWVRLDDDFATLPDSQYAGVYVLSYPDRRYVPHLSHDDLTGRRVREEDIFYVGVSHAGVRKRLRQFVNGVEDNDYHSGAMRFFTKVARGVPYSEFAERMPFFVAFVLYRSTRQNEATGQVYVETFRPKSNTQSTSGLVDNSILDRCSGAGKAHV